MAKKKIVVLVESPNKVSKISHLLNDLKDGNQYFVAASVGHFTRIADVGLYKAGIDLETMEPTYEIMPEKKDVATKINSLLKDCDEVWYSSDSDNEGHVIAWSYDNFLKIPKGVKKLRVEFLEITDKGIKDGMKNAKPFDPSTADAGRTRAELDKLVGYRLSPTTRQKVGAPSAGRVQSAALKILVDREKEIINFVPEEYFTIKLPFKKDKVLYKADYIGNGVKRITQLTSQAEADKVVKECKPGNYSVKDIFVKERNLNPKDAFTTSTLQQAASSNLGYSPKKTMEIAQKLFEGGYITYHRTDSVRLSEDFVAECKKKIEKEYGKNYYKGFSGKVSKDAQDAHEALRESKLENTPEKIKGELDNDQYKLYKLIYNRTLASLMSAAKIEDTDVQIHNGKHKFSIVGHKVLFDGFLRVMKDDDEELDALPTFKIDEKIKDEELEVEKKQTNPPNRFSEAKLVATLEKTGIGRPSTFASTVETLKSRKYIEIEKKAIHVTDLGMRCSEMLAEYFSEIINTEYTAKMEGILDEIAAGRTDRVTELKKFWEEFNPLVLKANREIGKDKPKPEETDEKCPNCGKNLLIRTSMKGTQFKACSGYPTCKFTAPIDKPLEEVIAMNANKTGIKCPKCKKGELVKRKAGATGEVFYGCSQFSKGCKFTLKEDEFNEKYILKGETKNDNSLGKRSAISGSSGETKTSKTKSSSSTKGTKSTVSQRKSTTRAKSSDKAKTTNKKK